MKRRTFWTSIGLLIAALFVCARPVLAQVSIDPGPNPSIPVATELIGGVYYQYIKLIDPTASSTTPIGTSSNPLRINPTGTTAQPVTDNGGSLTVDGSVTVAQSTASSLKGTMTLIDGSGDSAMDNTNDAVRVVVVAAGAGVETQYTEADTDSTITGTAILWEDTSDTLRAVSAAKPLPVGDAGGSLTVDGTVAATQSGTWSVRAQDGSGNALTSRAAGSSRAIDIAIVDGSGSQITSFGGGTEYSEDAAHTTGDKVTVAGVVRKDTATQLAGTDGDYSALVNDASGRLHVNVGTSALPTGASTLAEQQTQTTSLQVIDDIVVTEDTASANADKGVTVWAKRTASPANTSGTDGDYEALQISAGRLWSSCTIDAAIPTGANVIGAVTGSGNFNVGSVVPGVGGTNFGKAEDATHGTGDTGIAVWTVRKDTTPASTAGSDGDYAGLMTDGSGRLWTTAVIDTALPAGTNAIGKLAANSGVDIGDVDVTSLPALAAGTNTIGGVRLKPDTTGGLSVYRNVDIDEADQQIKGTAGQVYGWYLFCARASTCFYRLYDQTAASTTVGSTTPKLTIPVPAGGAANVEFATGIAFGTAITLACTTGVGDSDTGAPAANDCVANVLYN